MTTDKLPFVVSRKILISVESNLKSLIDKTYTEQTIKELLISLRELRDIALKNTKPRIEKFDNLFKDFIDVCDCIVHSNRDKGILENNIRKHIEKMASALNNGDNRSWYEVSAMDKFIPGDSMVAGMLAFITMYLSNSDKGLLKQKLITIFEDKSDISLCIISLLQGTIIKLKDHGIACLHILSHEGQYRLYCSVRGSLIERDSKERTGGEGSVIIGFPVIVTNAKNIDDLCFDEPSEKEPQLIETYRGEDRKLHVRFVDEEEC